MKLEFMKQFMMALPLDGCCFNYICNFFPGISKQNLKAGLFDSPEIQKIIRN